MKCTKAFELTVVPASDCPLSDMTWSSTITSEDTSGVPPGTPATGQFEIEAHAIGGAPFQSDVKITWTKVYTGDAKNVTFSVTFTQLGGNNAYFEYQVESDIDGVLLSGFYDQTDGPGTYTTPYVIPASVGATITVYVYAKGGFVDFGPGTGDVSATGTFCA